MLSHPQSLVARSLQNVHCKDQDEQCCVGKDTFSTIDKIGGNYRPRLLYMNALSFGARTPHPETSLRPAVDLGVSHGVIQV